MEKEDARAKEDKLAKERAIDKAVLKFDLTKDDTEAASSSDSEEGEEDIRTPRGTAVEIVPPGAPASS